MQEKKRSMPKMKNVTLSVLAVVLLTSVGVFLVIHYQPCPGTIELVCGTDQVTYANSCRAKRNFVDVASTGSCVIAPSDVTLFLRHGANDAPLSCGDTVQYMCGTDGKTYSNNCLLADAKVKLAYVGECSSTGKLISQTSCTTEIDLVCGYSGITYQNKCLADYYNSTIVSRGACEECSNIDYVCGVNGITYDSECDAKLRLVEVAHTGRCTVS